MPDVAATRLRPEATSDQTQAIPVRQQALTNRPQVVDVASRPTPDATDTPLKPRQHALLGQPSQDSAGHASPTDFGPFAIQQRGKLSVRHQTQPSKKSDEIPLALR